MLPRAETGGRGAWRRGSGMKPRPGGGQGGFEASGIGLEKEGQPSSPRRGGQKGKGMRTGEAVAAGNGRGLSCPPFLVTFLTFMDETCELSRVHCAVSRGASVVSARACVTGVRSRGKGAGGCQLSSEAPLTTLRVHLGRQVSGAPGSPTRLG